MEATEELQEFLKTFEFREMKRNFGEKKALEIALKVVEKSIIDEYEKFVLKRIGRFGIDDGYKLAKKISRRIELSVGGVLDGEN